MKDLKRFAVLLLTGVVTLSSACTLVPSAPDTGKDDGGRNAVVSVTDTGNNGNDADTQGSNETGTDDTNEGNTDNADPENTDGALMSEEDFLYAPMKCQYHAYCEGKVYFREYDYDDYFNSVILYFSDPFVINYQLGNTYRLYSIDADGNIELVNDKDTGSGALYALNGKLYSGEFYVRDDGKTASRVYSYDVKTGDKKTFDGFTDVLGTVGDCFISRTPATYDDSGYYSGKICIVNPETGENIAEAEGDLIGTDDYSGAAYVMDCDIDYDSSTTEVTITALYVYGNEIELAHLDNSYFENWFEDYAEVTCLQTTEDDLFVNLGYHSGTGYFYNEGFILDIQKDGSGFTKVCDTTEENFYIAHNNDGYTLNLYGYDYEYGPFVDLYSIGGSTGKQEAEGYIGQEYGVPYIHYSDDDVNDHLTFKKGDVSIYSDDTGKIRPLVLAEDYEPFGLKMGLYDENDYENSDTMELYNIEYAGNYVFFSLAEMARYPVDDVGWRMAYRGLHYYDFVKNLQTGEVKLIHEAQ